jgi:hypothetical protein
MHADLGVQLPFAHFTAARLQLIAGRGDAALAAWCRGIALALGPDSGARADVIDGERQFLERIAGHRDRLPGHGRAVALLSCAAAAASGDAATPHPDPPPSGGREGALVLIAGARHESISKAVAGLEVTPVAGIDAALAALAAGFGRGLGATSIWLLGSGGGDADGLIYRIGAALGVHVGLVRRSGGAADVILGDAEVTGACALPGDPLIIATFLAPRTRMAETMREPLGRAIHQDYVDRRTRELSGGDRALVPWASLDDGLRESNRQQADDIAAKLAAIGCELVPATAGAPPFAFTAAELEQLAELEHARWTVERLRTGWRPGDRDPAARRSPYLVPWAELAEPIRDLDRAAVAAIPALLATIGLTARRRS